ncbi:MAG: iron-containing alcohol dehydrogenase [Clostridia bacterium]|nr:iron-containing alcohol dehydrogenase [Clostridia bacterium]
MLGNFTFSIPTRVHFGDKALDSLKDELARFGETVLLTYGGGSIKKTGLYDRIVGILTDAGKEIVELPGVMPNPTADKLREGAKLAREVSADLILAVGGGSVIDYSKAVSVSAWCDEDPWDKYYLRMEDPDNKIIPVGSVLTMVGTGSEMNGGAVITNPEQKLKIGHVFGDEVFPKFSILDPVLTFTVPERQMVAGIFDMFNHITEQYFSGDDDNTSDYLAEGLMRNVIVSGRHAVKDPENYEARSNLMWDASLALNTLIALGKSTDWEVHMIGQAVGALTDATHGLTLAAVAPAYYRLIMPFGLERFKRFAEHVWDVDPAGKTDKEVAEEGIRRMEEWMQEIGVAKNLTELGVTEDMLDDIVKGTFIMEGGYHVLTKDEILDVLKASM